MKTSTTQTTTRGFCLALAAFVAAFVATTSLNAQVLMIDFGPTTVDEDNLLNSPYHIKAGTAFTGTTWNKVQKVDIAAGSLKWSDNTVATNLTLNIAASAGSSSLVELSRNPNQENELGKVVKTGVYTGGSVGKDAIYYGTSNSNLCYVGFQLGGLATGTYDIYVTARNTNAQLYYTQSVFVGTSSASGDFTPTDLAFNRKLESLYDNANKADNYIDEWVDGGNYLKFTITLSAGEFLNLAAIGSDGEKRGFLNSVQIVAVPEPTTIALIAGIGILTVAIVRRRFIR